MAPRQSSTWSLKSSWPGALFDHPTQQFAQRLLLFGAEHAEHLLVRGDGVADHRGDDVAALIGEVGLQDAPVLGILLPSPPGRGVPAR